MFVLYNLKIVVQASMNPFFSRYFTRVIKHATIGKVVVGGGVAVATVGGGAYDHLMLESTTTDGDPSKLARWPNGIVQMAQRSCNLCPYNSQLSKGLSHAFSDVDIAVREFAVYNEKTGFMEGESTKKALKENGFLFRDGRIIEAPKGLVSKIFK
jgi:hypothetical protein